MTAAPQSTTDHTEMTRLVPSEAGSGELLSPTDRKICRCSRRMAFNYVFGGFVLGSIFLLVGGVSVLSKPSGRAMMAAGLVVLLVGTGGLLFVNRNRF